jgi:hypothetical protein
MERPKKCSNCNNGFAKNGITCNDSNLDRFNSCEMGSKWEPANENQEITQTEKIKQIYDYFGMEEQLKKTIEGVHGLSVAVASRDRKSIVDELADVVIMSEYIKLVKSELMGKCKITEEEVEKVKNTKIERTLERIKEGLY